ECDLAEVVARATGADAVPLVAVVDGALADDEEADAALPLGRDHVAFVERALLERLRQPFEIAVGHALEDLDLADQLGRGRHEGASLSLGTRRVDPLRQLLDPAFGRLQVGRAEAVQLLATLPELQRFVEPCVAALELLDDLRELLLGLLVRHSTLAPNAPSDISTVTASPGTTPAAVRTSAPSRRTIA